MRGSGQLLPLCGCRPHTAHQIEKKEQIVTNVLKYNGQQQGWVILSVLPIQQKIESAKRYKNYNIEIIQ